MIDLSKKIIEIGGIPISEIMNKYGDTLYIYDADTIENQYKKIRNNFSDDIDIFYSLKPNPNISIVSYIKNFVQGAEVCSLGELFLARESGFAPSNIIFVGPSKSMEEIEACINEGIYAIVAENLHEIKLINELSTSRKSVITPIMIRINPSFSTEASKLTMGGIPRQFGLDEEYLPIIFDEIKKMNNIKLLGIHVYMGTRILESEAIIKNTQEIIKLARKLRDEHNIDIKVVDFGGGLGVPYFKNENSLDIDSVGPALKDFFHKMEQEGFKPDRYILEVGRYLVAESGIYSSKIQYVKESRGINYILLGGGTNHHMPAVGIGSFVKQNFPIVVGNKLQEKDNFQSMICGPLCTPNDVIGKNVNIPKVNDGDIICVLNSGAYALTASPIFFLSHQQPAEIFIHRGESHIIREKSKLKDILLNQKKIIFNNN